MQKNIKKLLVHLLLFVCIELIFTILIFHELPKISIVSVIGIVHIVYFVLVVVAGVVREYVQYVWVKFLCTYLPIVLHVLGHIWVAERIIEDTLNHHHDHGIGWIIGATGGAGILIGLGERLIHRKEHCDVYHQSVHKYCKQNKNSN